MNTCVDISNAPVTERKKTWVKYEKSLVSICIRGNLGMLFSLLCIIQHIIFLEQFRFQ